MLSRLPFKPAVHPPVSVYLAMPRQARKRLTLMSLWERWRAAVTRYDITLFKSTGIAVQNVIAAKLVYEAARMRGVGIAM